MMLALFSVSPIFTSCLFGLFYCLYYFIANESSSAMHHAQVCHVLGLSTANSGAMRTDKSF